MISEASAESVVSDTIKLSESINRIMLRSRRLVSPGRAATDSPMKKGKHKDEVMHILFQKLALDHEAFNQMKPDS